MKQQSLQTWSGRDGGRNKSGYRPGKFGRGEFPRSGNPHEKGKRGGVKLYDAVCAQCGKETLVPFMPNGSKPVLCRDCMDTTRQQGSTGRFHEERGNRDDRHRSSYSDRSQFSDRGNSYHQRDNNQSALNERLTSIEVSLLKLTSLLEQHITSTAQEPANEAPAKKEAPKKTTEKKSPTKETKKVVKKESTTKKKTTTKKTSTKKS